MHAINDQVIVTEPTPIAPTVRLFEPGRYLTKVGVADYLEVKWRLVWLREVHPDAVIETELVSHVGQDAIFRARVTVPGGGSATGFGTQFCPDFEFGAHEGRVVDAPVDFARTQGVRSTPSNATAPVQRSQPAGTMSAKQAGFLASLARTLRLSEEELGREAQAFCGKSVDELGRREASQFIDHLQARRAAV